MSRMSTTKTIPQTTAMSSNDPDETCKSDLTLPLGEGPFDLEKFLRHIVKKYVSESHSPPNIVSATFEFFENVTLSLIVTSYR